MNITAITQQGRLKNRYSIYIDGVYSFSLSADALLVAKLYIGQELAIPEIEKYKKLSTDDKAYNLALAHVLRRMRSSHEFDEYCKDKGYDNALSQRIRGRLERLGLIDDEKFAEAWIRNRRLLRPMSKRRLTLELKQKRVPEDIIERAITEDESDDRSVLRELIRRRRKQSKYQDELKLMQYLARQGFSYEDIRTELQTVES
jgi:regulatory protein